MLPRTKYPKTWHLPWSNGNPSNDKTHPTDELFHGKDVVVTLKMDGENTTLYGDGLHPRSLIMDNHPSRDWVKKMHGEIAHEIPHNWRICGENLYAQHSIVYKDLPTYFMVFSIWEDGACFDWDTTEEYCKELKLTTVPVIYRGTYSKELIEHIFRSSYEKEHEGYVVRLASGFKLEDFTKSLAKYVRPNHIQTDEHWMNKKVEPNGLK